MAMVMVIGASSGALHAVTGPDHVLSLGPTAVRMARGAWRVGLLWGVGHGIGTLLLALPLWALSRTVVVDGAFVSVAEGVAGVVLVVSGGLAVLRARPAAAVETTDARWGLSLWVGLVHGATGAGALLLVLPVLLHSSLSHIAAYLVAFGVGGALAMAALTTGVARVGQHLGAEALLRVQRAGGAAAVLLGAWWLVGAL